MSEFSADATPRPVEASASGAGPRFLGGAVPVPGPTDHKYTRGVVTVATGSESYPGAALLGTEAAARCGVGMVRYWGPDSVARMVVQRTPEVVPSPGHSQVFLAGSGWDGGGSGSSSTDESRHADVFACAEETSHNPLFVLDAGALDCVQQGSDDERDSWRSVAPRSVLTPHAGEAASLLARLDAEAGESSGSGSGSGQGAGEGEGSAEGDGEWSRERVEADPREAGVRLAELTRATIILKGHTTYVCAPEDEVLEVTSPSSRLAVAGTGDVLAGFVAGLLALNHREITGDQTVTGSQTTTADQSSAADDAAGGAGRRRRSLETCAAAVELHGLCALAAAGSANAPILAHDLSRVAPRVIGQAQRS